MNDFANGPMLLDDAWMSTADVCRVSGLPDLTLRNWIARAVLPPIGRKAAGRMAFNVLDAIRLAVMRDLTARVSMPPIEAAKAAELVVRRVEQHTPTGVADPNAVPNGLALALAFVEGEAFVGWVDPAQPGGYAEWQGEWGRAHIVLPIASLLRDVLWRASLVSSAHRVLG